MKILLHICCAPCLIYPLGILREMQAELTGFFFNPNIHPSREYLQRGETLATYADQAGLPIIWGDYRPEDYFQGVNHREEERCQICYRIRLEAAAGLAKNQGFEGFTSTLLYSRFQKHDIIREVGRQIARETSIPFIDQDFRRGWQEGVAISKEMGMYRQNYCGCLYSERDRNRSQVNGFFQGKPLAKFPQAPGSDAVAARPKV